MTLQKFLELLAFYTRMGRLEFTIRRPDAPGQIRDSAGSHPYVAMGMLLQKTNMLDKIDTARVARAAINQIAPWRIELEVACGLRKASYIDHLVAKVGMPVGYVRVAWTQVEKGDKVWLWCQADGRPQVAGPHTIVDQVARQLKNKKGTRFFHYPESLLFQEREVARRLTPVDI